MASSWLTIHPGFLLYFLVLQACSVVRWGERPPPNQVRPLVLGKSPQISSTALAFLLLCILGHRITMDRCCNRNMCHGLSGPALWREAHHPPVLAQESVCLAPFSVVRVGLLPESSAGQVLVWAPYFWLHIATLGALEHPMSRVWFLTSLGNRGAATVSGWTVEAVLCTCSCKVAMHGPWEGSAGTMACRADVPQSYREVGSALSRLSGQLGPVPP